MTGIRRAAPWSQDTGSIAFALLLTLVGVTLSALLLPMVLTQIKASRTELQRVHALHAAQAGLDAALGQMRAAGDGAGAGVIAKLPCGPLTGAVSAAGNSRYQIRVVYFNTDPTGKPDSWLDDPNNPARVKCVPGYGTKTTPAYASLRADGTDLPGTAFNPSDTRSVRATYQLRTSNANIAGGFIRTYLTPPNGKELCVDATAANLYMQECNGSDKQMWAYNTNLTVSLAGTNLCMAAVTPQDDGSAIRLVTCTLPAPPEQVWINSDGGNLYSTADGESTDGYCIHPQTRDLAGSPLELFHGKGKQCSGYSGWVETFEFQAAVGAGAAGASSGQLVNYYQFGRCLDVTKAKVDATYLIVWPCKQSPDPTSIAWNQRWVLPAITAPATSATGRITTNPNNGLYCLRSPGSTAAGQYVTLLPCPTGSTTPTDLKWTVYGDTGVPSTGYRIRDGYGYCLAPTDRDAPVPDVNETGASKVVMAPCTGGLEQKWNAPPTILQSSPLRGISER